MRTTLTLLLVLSPVVTLAADKLAERDARVNRIARVGVKITFDNRKKERPPVALRLTHVPDKDIRADIDALDTLQFVEAEIKKASDEDLEPIAKLPQLKRLTITGDFGDDSVKALANATKLERLTIGSSKLTNQCLPVIGELPKLSSLIVSQSRAMDDAGLKLLRPARELRVLDANGFIIDGSGFADLKALTRLEEFSAHGVQITDNSIRPLRDLKLKSLRLSNTSVTDAGLRHIEEMDGLRLLSISGVAITRDGINSLSRKKPRLQINK